MMGSHRAAFALIAAAALAVSAPSSAQDSGRAVLARKNLTEGIGPATPSAELFLRAYEVFSHPRCSNCHPRDDRPRWGATGQIHGMNVQRGEPHPPEGTPAQGKEKGNYGRIGMNCMTCHQSTNGELPGSPPGAWDDERQAPAWRLSPPQMGWGGLTPRELCMRLQGLGLNDAIGHILNVASESDPPDTSKVDPLVRWAWRPGPGREPAPGTLEQFVNVLKWWKGGGAACP
jgi:hypothetical protein